MIKKISAKLFNHHYAWHKGPHVYYFKLDENNVNKILVENVLKIMPIYEKIPVFEIDWKSQLSQNRDTSTEYLKRVCLHFKGTVTEAYGLDLKNILILFNKAIDCYNEILEYKAKNIGKRGIIIRKNKTISANERKVGPFTIREYNLEVRRRGLIRQKLKKPNIDINFLNGSSNIKFGSQPNNDSAQNVSMRPNIAPKAITICLAPSGYSSFNINVAFNQSPFSYNPAINIKDITQIKRLSRIYPKPKVNNHIENDINSAIKTIHIPSINTTPKILITKQNIKEMNKIDHIQFKTENYTAYKEKEDIISNINLNTESDIQNGQIGIIKKDFGLKRIDSQMKSSVLDKPYSCKDLSNISRSKSLNTIDYQYSSEINLENHRIHNSYLQNDNKISVIKFAPFSINIKNNLSKNDGHISKTDYN